MNRSRFAPVSSSLLALVLLAGSVFAPVANAAPIRGGSQEALWKLQATPAARSDREVSIPARKFQAFTADVNRLRAALAAAPLDLVTAAARNTVVRGNPVEISLPMPRDGKLARFRVEEVAIMEPGLAAQFPDIKTYRGSGIDDPAAQLALDVTPYGFHAQILSPSGRVYISPYYFGGADDLYASYLKEDAVSDPAYPWVCEFKGFRPGGAVTGFEDPKTVARTAADLRAAPAAAAPVVQPQTSFGGSLRVYRLAVAANHQYAATTGGTVSSTIAAIVVVINRVSAIYEADCGLRLVLITNETPIIYTDAANDPFSANGTGVINTSTSVISAAVGVGNYDIGHVFTTGSGGISGLGVVCNTSSKGRSTTGLPNPYGDAFSVDFVVHEMGHEFGANHTFNGGITSAGSCSGGNRSGAHAYEPGSGTTIMAYAGICGVNNDLQPHSDSMFHHESISEILTFTAGATGSSCPVTTANANSIPTVSAGNTYTIPVSTPFTLTGSGLDTDGDTLTYSWEERDRGLTQTDANAADNGNTPLFRTFAPVYSPSRTFPKMSDIVNNTTTIGEKLPALARVMTMRLTVRDNRSGGGATNSADTTITVVAGAGPFVVTYPNTAITMGYGAQFNVTWSVANTDTVIGTSAVNIRLSMDGGYTYPYLLAAGKPNNGSATVVLPSGSKTVTTARIKVEAADNVYFDISDVNFTISPL